VARINGKMKPIEIAREQRTPMSAINRSAIKAGALVQVVQKQDQRTGKLTEGVVKDILTKSATHPHGIKVRLSNGVVGRVKKVLSRENLKS
jgi:uncharacterized repeat protein (TIGR03833 family)